MKKLLMAIFVVFAFAACAQNDVEELAANRADVPETLTVGFEGSDTRIQLNEAQKTVWTKDDLVSVFYLSNANQKWQYQGETGERVGVLKCVESALPTKETDCVVVAYPYNDNYYLNASSCNLRASLPATQHYLKDSYGLDGNIMVSRGEYNQVSLRNVCGWLKVQLAGDNQVVKSIKLYGNNGEQVAGELYINTNDATAILASDMGIIPGSDEEGAGGVGGGLQFNNTIYTDVMLVCDEEVVLGSKATAFYIALPPQTFENGVTVEVKCKGYEPMVISTDNALTIQRNHIKPMETVEFNAAKSELKYGDLQLDITISNVQAFSAQLHLVPSSDEQYACAMLAANQLPQIEDEVELMTVLIDQFMPATFVGEINETLTPLMPETEYVVVAFGFDGTYPTSHLFTERFTTANQEAGKTYIEDIRVLHIFDVAEIAALEPKYEPLLEEAECLVVVEAVTNRPCDSVYYFWYESWMMYEYSKEAFVEDLLLYKPIPSPTVVSLWYSADEFFFAGMAQDEDGNFSDVYFGEPAPILYENRSPAAEYFNLGIDIYVPEYNM